MPYQTGLFKSFMGINDISKHLLEIFLHYGDIIKIHPALYVWIIMVLILIVTRELNVKLLQQALS